MSIKISELPQATSVGSNDVIPIVQSGTTKQATVNDITSKYEDLSSAISYTAPSGVTISNFSAKRYGNMLFIEFTATYTSFSGSQKNLLQLTNCTNIVPSWGESKLGQGTTVTCGALKLWSGGTIALYPAGQSNIADCGLMTPLPTIS